MMEDSLVIYYNKPKRVLLSLRLGFLLPFQMLSVTVGFIGEKTYSSA